ncbi:MAG TPA: rRNA maturation RNase YbeY [Thermodesulfobacteriota bacterium]|nr:rRNA maturation RNase YbeY [Thermodesulfobacteriota bacterium]
MKIALTDETGELDASYRARVKKIAGAVLGSLDVDKASELSVTFIGDAEMRALNKSWRGIDRATDVLSFPQDGEGPVPLLGDIVISLDTTRRHAVRYGNTFHEEIKKLIVHGILHLLGHDHKKKKEKEIMRGLEEELLEEIREL